MKEVIDHPKFKSFNTLIIGAPRSGTHALASSIYKKDLSLQYRAEIARFEKSDTPWKDLDDFCKPALTRKLAHIVQPFSKIFLAPRATELKKYNLLVELRRRNKIDQFASWAYFKHIGSIYRFDHSGQDYCAPGALTVTLGDIEQFLIAQMLDSFFSPDITLYYEDIDFSDSRIKKNVYSYPIRNIISNLDLVEHYLGNWTYYEQR